MWGLVPGKRDRQKEAGVGRFRRVFQAQLEHLGGPSILRDDADGSPDAADLVLHRVAVDQGLEIAQLFCSDSGHTTQVADGGIRTVFDNALRQYRSNAGK